MLVHISTINGTHSENEDGGQSSRGTLKVAPSGGNCAVGEEGAPPAWPCILLNCFAILPFQVFDLGDAKGSSVWLLGLRVLLTGDCPVGDRFLNDVSFLMPLWLGRGLNRWPLLGETPPLGVVGPVGVCGTACCFDVQDTTSYFNKRFSWKIHKRLDDCKNRETRVVKKAIAFLSARKSIP